MTHLTIFRVVRTIIIYMKNVTEKTELPDGGGLGLSRSRTLCKYCLFKVVTPLHLSPLLAAFIFTKTDNATLIWLGRPRCAPVSRSTPAKSSSQTSAMTALASMFDSTRNK